MLYYFLQILPTHFGCFLMKQNLSKLRLCGPSNKITTCKLIFKHNEDRTNTVVRIG